jgi:8-oxo-dGTP pyrophosphatase MutT (NUDIX family)
MKKKQPKFKAKPGQMDYTHARWAPVINCVVRHGNKILMVQRSAHLDFHPSYWNGISGFIDDQLSLKEKVIEELREETGIPKNKIKKIRLGEIFDHEDKDYKKTWIVHPVLVDVTTDQVKLDWESEQHAWLPVSAIKKLKLMPGFNDVLRNLSL